MPININSALNDSSEDSLVGRIEDDPIAQQLPERATFIPLRHAEMASKLAKEFSIADEELKDFKHLCARLQAIFHVEHLSVLINLESLYDALDPDSQLVEIDAIDNSRRDRLANRLIDRLSELLISAHYKKLTNAELERAVEIGCQWGVGVQLKVDFDIFERLEVFARGYRTVVARRRRWNNLFRLETIELPEFQRLILAFRVKPELEEDAKKRKGEAALENKFVYIKTFKNIPETDLEILLPGSTVRLTKLDRARILLPTVSGAAITMYKIFRGALVLTLAFAWEKVLGWIILIGASIGYIFKSVVSYFQTKTKYQFGLTKSLYLKNLDNNSSAIYRILNEAEEQELSEAILAYTFLWQRQQSHPEGMTERDLDDMVEVFLTRTTGIDVDFEVHDALEKLARLGLAEKGRGEQWRVRELHEATEYLNRNWSALFESRARAVVTGVPIDDDLFTS